MLPPSEMMTTKKRRRRQCHLVFVAALATLLTACGPPGARQMKRGEQEIRAEQSDAAISELKDAVSILHDAPHPVQAKAWNLLGLACQESGRSDDAAKSYMTALKLDRNNAAIDYNLGCLQIQRTNYPGAIDYLTTYVTLRPADLQGYLRLGTAQFHSALEQRGVADRNRLLEAARRSLQNAEKVGTNAETANALGLLDLQHRPISVEAVNSSVKEFKLALQRDENYAPALLNLAILSQQYLNQPVQALNLYRKYLTLTPPPPYVAEVTKLVHDLDLKQRIIITPETAPTPAPTHTSVPQPSSAPTPVPPPAKLVVVPSNQTAPTPKPLPAESPPVREVVATSPPATTSPPASVSAPATLPAALPVSSSSITPRTTTGTAIKPTSSDSVPEPVVTETTRTPRKSISQRLNPLNWFSGKPKAGGAANEDEPPPLPPGSRYEYPPTVTPIPGDRAQAKQLVAEAVHERQLGDTARSLGDYQAATTADPTFYEAYYGLGVVALNTRDYPRALEALHRALALQENSIEARYAFAWALQKRGYTEDALHELTKLVELHPSEARAHLLLGSLYAEKLHQPKLAREHFLQTLELDPGNAQADSIRAWLKLNP